MTDAIAVIFALGAIALGIWLLSLLAKRVRRDAKPSSVEPSAAASEAPVTPSRRGVRAGECIVCGNLAHRKWPMIIRAKHDKDFFGYRQLHNLPPMYQVSDSGTDENVLCVPHHRMAHAKLEQELAEIRAAMAACNAEVDRRLATLEMGGLLTHLQIECKKSEEKIDAMRANGLQLDEPAPLQLTVRSSVPEGIGTTTLKGEEET